MISAITKERQSNTPAEYICHGMHSIIYLKGIINHMFLIWTVSHDKIKDTYRLINVRTLQTFPLKDHFPTDTSVLYFHIFRT